MSSILLMDSDGKLTEAGRVCLLKHDGKLHELLNAAAIQTVVTVDNDVTGINPDQMLQMAAVFEQHGEAVNVRERFTDKLVSARMEGFKRGVGVLLTQKNGIIGLWQVTFKVIVQMDDDDFPDSPPPSSDLDIFNRTTIADMNAAEKARGR